MKTNENGFSLIELLIATVLLGVLFVGTMIIFGQSTSSSSLIRSKIIAINYAKERIELLKQFETAGKDRDSAVWKTTSSKTVNGRTFTITSDIVPDSELSTAYKSSNKYVIPVRITVSWFEKTKLQKVITETFYYEKYSL